MRPDRSRGVTLVELIVFIVIVSVGLAGVLTALNVAVKGSADPLQPKQALAIAEAILEEVLLKDYCDPSLPGVVNRTGNISTATAQVTSIDTTGILAGWQVLGDGIPGGTTVASVDSVSQLTLSVKPLKTVTGAVLQSAQCEDVEASRDDYDNVRDYHGYSQATATSIDGTSLTGYAVAVAVPSATVTVGGYPGREVTVTVTAPSGSAYTLTGYRMPY